MIARDDGGCIVKDWQKEAKDNVHVAQALRQAQAAITAMSSLAAKDAEKFRHEKRGTVYEVVGTAELQMTYDNLVDGSDLVIYRGEDGKLWCREEGEFHDGRFQALGDEA